MNSLKIAGIKISQNENGLYSLNDLHRASGGLAKQTPYEFLRSDRTKAFIAVLGRNVKAGYPVFTETARGVGGGTFGCKEVLVAYGSWLSPEMDVEVHQAFIEKIEQKPLSPAEQIHQMSGWMVQAEQKLALIPAIESDIQKLKGLTKQLTNSPPGQIPKGYMATKRTVAVCGRGISKDILMSYVFPHFGVPSKIYNAFHEDGGIVESPCWNTQGAHQAVTLFVATLWQVSPKFCESDILPEGKRVSFILEEK